MIVTGVSSNPFGSATADAPGTSFTGVTVSLKVSDAVSEPSLAVTLRSSAPL